MSSMSNMDLTQLQKLKNNELKEICKNLGIKNYSNKKKIELITLITSSTNNVKEENIIVKPQITTLHESISMDNDCNFTIAETFVGCGGSHFGFKKSGFKTIFINDIWEDAIKSLVQNDNLDENKVICDDIKNLNETYFHDKNINIGNVDVFIGGVVCKGFSLAGIRNPYDPRNYLYLEQLRLVGILKPKISIIENVPGMLNMKILEKSDDITIMKLCSDLNEICEKHKKVRGKLIAENKKLSNILDEKEKEFLIHTIENTKKEMVLLTQQRNEIEKTLENKKYSVVEHIEKLYNELGYDVYKKILACDDYNCFTSRHRLFIVAIRRDLNIKWEYPTPMTKDKKPIVKEAFDLIDYDGINNPNVDIDNQPMNHKTGTVEKFKKIKAGIKSDDEYFSRGTSSRLDLNKPAPTLVPGHSSFQIHPTEHRSITVREGATITGFNINYKFYGSHTSRCMQIGNAIPVNMAYALAEQCKKILNQVNKS